MEYLVIVLLLGVIALIWFRKPNKVYNAILHSILTELRKSEPELVKGVYNGLPPQVKQKVDSEMVAYVVSYVISIADDVLQEALKPSK